MKNFLQNCTALLAVVGAISGARAQNGQIAYESSRGDDFRSIFVANADGSNTRLFTSDGTFGTFDAALSPNGRRVAYAGSGRLMFVPSLYSRNLDGTRGGELDLSAYSSNRVWQSPAYSPDSSLIAFTRYGDAPVGLAVINADGSGLRNIFTNTADVSVDPQSAPSWSPSGQKLAFAARNAAGNSQIYIINQDGSGLRALTQSTSGARNPAWNPNGGQIAYVAGEYNQGEIYLAKADGSDAATPTQLTNNSFSDDNPAWNPGGARLAFDSDRSGDGEIWTMKSDGTELANISNSPGTDADPSWSIIAPISPPSRGPVTNTSDSGAGSLRNAILYANGHPGSRIKFNIPQTDPSFDGRAWTIRPAIPLPAISANDTIIDGSSQVAFGGDTNPGGLEIVLSGAGQTLPPDSSFDDNNGLRIAASRCLLKGLVINGFGYAGILICGPFTGPPPSQFENPPFKIAKNNRVEGCAIGTNSTGDASAGNRYGVYIQAPAQDNVGGGNDPTQRCVISGNFASGVVISGYGAPEGSGGPGPIFTTGNLIKGCRIGTSAFGNSALQNGGPGVHIIDSAINNRIGGGGLGAGNLISGNNGPGVQIEGFGRSGGSNSNFVQGNFIGTDVSGTAALPNGNPEFSEDCGLLIRGTVSGNLVGGEGAGKGNIISGNRGGGIYINATPDRSGGNDVLGNFIGIGAQNGPLGNFADSFRPGDGVRIVANKGGKIGGITAGRANRIAFNAGAGVRIFGETTTIRGNSIFENGGLGINLTPENNDETVTPNDPGDVDAGPNGLQNFPVLTKALVRNGGTNIGGTLNSNSGGSFFVDFYSNPTADASGHGEGKVWLGSIQINTDGNGTAPFVFRAAGDLSGQFISATATDASGNTSEFSATLQASASASGKSKTSQRTF